MLDPFRGCCPPAPTGRAWHRKGNDCRSVTQSLPNATKSSYCMDDSGQSSLSITYPTALVDITVTDSRTDKPDYLAAMESDVDALNLK